MKWNGTLSLCAAWFYLLNQHLVGFEHVTDHEFRSEQAEEFPKNFNTAPEHPVHTLLKRLLYPEYMMLMPVYAANHSAKGAGVSRNYLNEKPDYYTQVRGSNPDSPPGKRRTGTNLHRIGVQPANRW
jgi:hypothetical protein